MASCTAVRAGKPASLADSGQACRGPCGPGARVLPLLLVGWASFWSFPGGPAAPGAGVLGHARCWGWHSQAPRGPWRAPRSGRSFSVLERPRGQGGASRGLARCRPSQPRIRRAACPAVDARSCGLWAPSSTLCPAASRQPPAVPSSGQLGVPASKATALGERVGRRGTRSPTAPHPRWGRAQRTGFTKPGPELDEPNAAGSRQFLSPLCSAAQVPLPMLWCEHRVACSGTFFGNPIGPLHKAGVARACWRARPSRAPGSLGPRPGRPPPSQEHPPTPGA